jgi:hypothetical protein
MRRPRAEERSVPEKAGDRPMGGRLLMRPQQGKDADEGSHGSYASDALHSAASMIDQMLVPRAGV